VWTSGFPAYSTWPASTGFSAGFGYFPSNRWGGWGWRSGWRGGWGGGWRGGRWR
jgi:hypothetical protein